MKRKVSDLLDDLEVTDVEIEYSAPLSYRRIEELTMSKITKKETKHRRIGFRVLAAAAVIAALALTSVAAYNYGGWFQNYFAAQNNDHLSEDQLAVLEESILEIGQSVTDCGYTVTLESVVSDGMDTYLKLTATALDGRVLDGKYYYFRGIDVDIPQKPVEDHLVGVTSAGWDYADDEDTTDNVAPMLLEISGNNVANCEPGAVWTLTLGKLMESNGTDRESDKILAEGEWVFAFTLPEENAGLQELTLLTEPVTIQAQTYLENSSVPDKTVEVSMTSLVLRTLSATCTYVYGEGLKVDPVTVVLKDGTAMAARFSTASMDLDTLTVRHTFSFDTPVPLDQVDYVEFPGGVKICANE
ncbi:MAG: DUF4179 domain-containing protein [Oscillospiraceae bacterium]|nr:DUF4179 domain-containing protein [Oscillospiraceae bacterium]